MGRHSGIIGYLIAWLTIALLVVMGILGFFLILRAIVKIVTS